VAERADFALPHAAIVASMVLGDVLMLDPTLALPTLQHHPDAADPGQLALEILIEGGFALTDDEEQPDPRKRPGWQAVEQAESVAPADAVSFGRVVERRPLTEVRRLALALTPGARHSHAGSLAGRAQSRGRMVASGDCNSTAGASGSPELSGNGIESSQALARHREQTAWRFGKPEQFMAGGGEASPGPTPVKPLPPVRGGRGAAP